MNRDKYIVITSIYPPTSGITAFSQFSNWQVVVVGDKKTPETWSHPNTTFLSLQKQQELFPEIANLIPENTYIRKMIGYLYANSLNAKYIFETDDDNLPHKDALTELNHDVNQDCFTLNSINTSASWFNIYSLFSDKLIWPRGYPLEYIKNVPEITVESKDTDWSVIQYLADDDPDVDAIYRMTNGEAVKFLLNRGYAINQNTYSPINSQVTLWKGKFFPLMFFPVGVPDRVTDILRGYMVQACLWKLGFTLTFKSPIVYQERNQHNLHKDFKDEQALYINASRWGSLLLGVSGNTPKQLMESAINLLVADGSLDPINIKIYQAFANNLTNV